MIEARLDRRPIIDLRRCHLDFNPEPGTARDFLRVYHDAGGPADIVGRGSFALAVAVQSHIADTYARLGIASPTGEQGARMAYRIDELDRTLFTLGSIDRLLDALSA